MDKRSIVENLAEAFKSFGEPKVYVKFSSDEDIVEIKIVSDLFENIAPIIRLMMVHSAMLKIASQELRRFSISVIPLAESEAAQEGK
jgi:hypothetical protein